MDVRESLQNYFTDCTYRNLSIHTLRVYRQRLAYFVDFLTEKGIHDTDQLSSDHLRSFIVDLKQRDAHQYTNHHSRGKPLSNRTIFHYSRIIKSFGEWLCEQEITPRNPFHKVKMPRVEKKLMPAMPVPAMVKLYDVIHNTGGERVSRDLALYSFMIESGARAAEVMKLTLDDIDLDGCTNPFHRKIF